MRLLPALALAALSTTVTPVLAETPRKPIDSVTSLRTRLPEWRRPLPAGGENLRLVGESADRLQAMYLTPAEAARPAQLRLTYISAVSVTPETSRLVVRINDTVIGERLLKASAKPETLTIDVPAGVLEPGFNAVRLSAQQTHRVDCSRDASYELWTQILPEQSGLVYQGIPAEVRDLGELPGVLRAGDGTLRIRARAAEGLDAASMARTARAVQAAVLLGRFDTPVVELDADEASEAGLDVVVGTDAMIQGLGVLPPAGAGPRVSVFTRPETGRTTLVVAGGTPAEVDQALSDLERQAREIAPTGSAAGLTALRASTGVKAKGRETLTLAELGVASQSFSGRYFRQAVQVMLPPDFFSAPYDRATLNVDAAYAGGLVPGAKMLVRVNGAVVATLPLRKDGGDVMRKRAVHLPLEVFKAGLNNIDIEADTGTEADLVCEPGVRAQSAERFLLADTTTLTIPGLARIASVPDIAAIPAGSLGLVAGDKPVTLFVPGGDGPAIEASLTLLARIAAGSGTSTRVEFTYDRPGPDAGHVLAIGAIGDLPDPLLSAAGLEPERLRDAWRRQLRQEPGRLEASKARIQVAAAGTVLQDLPIAAPASGAAPAEARPAPAPAKPQSRLSMSGSGGATFDFGALSRKAAAYVSETVNLDLNRLGFGQEVHKPVEVNEGTSLVLGQGARERPGQEGVRAYFLPQVASTTVITAPTAEGLRHSLTDMAAGALWQQLAGRSAAFDREQGVLRTGGSGFGHLVETQPFGIGNMRLVAAGWLSRHAPVYLAALFGGLGLLSLMLYGLVRRSGVRN